MVNNYFIIHGSYGNPYKNWIPWLKKELALRKFNCMVPCFSTPYKQDYESWSKILKSYYEIGYINETTTIIAHSLGSVFIVKFLIENKIKIKKLITVCGFNNLIFDKDMYLYESFYIDDEKLNDLKLYTDERISFYSDNDEYIPEKEATYFADKIDALKILVSGANHFSEKSGYKEFKEILKYL